MMHGQKNIKFGFSMILGGFLQQLSICLAPEAELCTMKSLEEGIKRRAGVK
jgi:hypothetical protein